MRALVLFSALLVVGVVRGELVPLRLKNMEREDRLPPAAAAKAGVTEIVEAELPIEPGENWEDERLSEIAQAQLKKILAAKTKAQMAALVTEDFKMSAELVGSERETIPGGRLQISRAFGGDLEAVSAAELLTDLAILGKAKLKVVEVEGRMTRMFVEADHESLEQAGVWNCTWDESTPPRLKILEVKSFEEVRSEGEWFIDATRSALGGNPRFDAQVMRGIGYWSQRITRIGDLAMSGHHGIAVGDVNGDGLEDVYACDGGSLPNQLYLQQPDGSAKEVAAQWGVAWLEDSRSALLVDLDNDGDQDLVVATIAMIAFAENNGAGKFELRGGFPGAPYPFSLSAADYDSDGDLDLYTCVYSAGDEGISGKRGFEASSPVPFNDAENGGRNVLLANLGGFQFADVTEAVGLEKNNTRWSFAAAWEDMDRDGDPDLYVANDFGRNCFYRNDGGQFVEIAAEAGVEDMAAGMSVAWGDYNADGAADLLVGNMFSSAGRRVSFQRDLGAGKTRMARGNSLFAGGVGAYRDVSEMTGITNGGWAWSSALADLDNDGLQDIVVSNGYISNSRADDL